MSIDLRARVFCNLGPCISGSIADDYLQDNGLVRVRGEVLLNGIHRPAPGTVVQLAYEKNGRLARIPRRLRVISYFADPLRNTTSVAIGCKLSYYENRKPPKKNITSDEENSSIPFPVRSAAIFPISASYIFNKCLSALDLTASSNPLTNRFSTSEFSLDSGYISVMSDLLKSEGYFGYINENEILQVVNATVDTGSGPVIDFDSLIDISPIDTGDLAGEAVIVNYSYLKLSPPSPEELQEIEDNSDYSDTGNGTGFSPSDTGFSFDTAGPEDNSFTRPESGSYPFSSTVDASGNPATDSAATFNGQAIYNSGIDPEAEAKDGNLSRPRRNWTLNEVEGLVDKTGAVTFTNMGVQYSAPYSYTPYTSTKETYTYIGDKDVVSFKQTKTNFHWLEAASQYYSEVSGFAGPGGAIDFGVLWAYQETFYYYDSNGELEKEITYDLIPGECLLAACPATWVYIAGRDKDGNIVYYLYDPVLDGLKGYSVADVRETWYETDEVAGLTRTITKRYTAKVNHSEGQNSLKAQFDWRVLNGAPSADIFPQAFELDMVDGSVNTNWGREYGIEPMPSDGALKQTQQVIGGSFPATSAPTETTTSFSYPDESNQATEFFWDGNRFFKFDLNGEKGWSVDPENSPDFPSASESSDGDTFSYAGYTYTFGEPQEDLWNITQDTIDGVTESQPTESDWSSSSFTDIEWVMGSPTSQTVIEFTMPYAGDEYLIGYVKVSSDAPSKARRFGTIQNRFLLGNRHGASIQIAPENMPIKPFDPVYISAQGFIGQYRVNGTTYAWDSNGLVASCDALFWGAVGSS